AELQLASLGLLDAPLAIADGCRLRSSCPALPAARASTKTTASLATSEPATLSKPLAPLSGRLLSRRRGLYRRLWRGWLRRRLLGFGRRRLFCSAFLSCGSFSSG